MAERLGFEPRKELPLCRFSRPVLSTTQPSLHFDNLLGAFTKKYINILNKDDLLDLEKLLNIDDTNLYNFYNGFKTDFEFENNNINYLYKNFNYTEK